MADKFAVIDTETNWNNEVISIGIVIAEDGRFEAIDNKYIIFEEAASVGGMYSYALYADGQTPEIFEKKKAIEAIKTYLNENGIRSIFAYNASFDARCLPELCGYDWHDIVRMAAYKQYNSSIPANAECCGTGRLKRGSTVQNILNMFAETDYMELHNALTDAQDELRIMSYLRHSISKYPLL
jgi:hypothetical protein